MIKKNLITFLWLSAILFTSPILAKSKQIIKIAYITQEQKVPAALSNLDPFIQNKGLNGAELSIQDNNTTGAFTNQKYTLIKIIVPLKCNEKACFLKGITKDVSMVVVNLPTDRLKFVADLPEMKQRLLFDVASRDDDLRGKQCRSNLLHLQPSRAMRADSLAQFMLKKKWKKWFLVTGTDKNDVLFAQAIKRAAKKFGMDIIEEKSWTHTYDARRSAQADVPTFTQDVKNYDVLVVADEKGLFGEYLDYRTWIPRPITGTQGLVATSFI